MKTLFNSRTPIAAIGVGAVLLPGLSFAEPKLVPVKGPDLHSFTKVDQSVLGSDSIRVTLGLSGFRKEAADAFVADIQNLNSPNYRHWIPTTEFGQYFGASDADIKALRDYLASNGFSNINVAAGKNFISATGTFNQAAAAFHTSFAHFARPADLVAKGEPTTFYGPAEPITLPENLAPKVSCACGFTDLAMQHHAFTKFAKSAAKKGKFTGYTPKQISTAYNNAPYVNSHPGHDMSIAVYSPTARNVNDPNVFASNLGISNDFEVIDVPIDGGTTHNGGLDEAALDAETIVGQANHAKVYMVECLDQNALDAYDWVGKQKSISIFSSSWFSYESAYVSNGKLNSGYPALFESTCQTLAASGVTLLNATGDDAWFGGPGVQSVTMEPSCPYVTAVGGTQLAINSDNTWKSETLWAYNGVRSNPSGGGGGESQIFSRPTWQTFVGPSNSFVDGFRMIPDVSANASNLDGYYYYFVVNESPTGYGGTSVSTPLWAANLLLMEQNWGDDGAKSVRLGCINATVYTMGNYWENPNDSLSLNTIFHDITVGSNGHFNCTTGWDLCSGWGSPDFGRLWTDASYLIGFNNLSPDVTPYAPGGWAHPLVVHEVESSQLEPSEFKHGVTYYLGAAAKNVGTADATPFPISVEIDGKSVVKATFKATGIGTVIEDVNFGSYVFTKGNHTIVYTVNAGGKMKEADQSNNTYTRTFTVK